MDLGQTNEALTVYGTTINVDLIQPSFSLRARSGHVYEALVSNLDASWLGNLK